MNLLRSPSRRLLTRNPIALLILAGVMAAGAPPAVGQEKPSARQAPEGGADDEKKPPAPPEPPPEKKSITSGAVTIGDEAVAYTATAGTLPLLKDDGSARGSIFYVAYSRDGVNDARTRPIAFCFNGGPGSSSVWLHLGALGPRRVALPPDGVEPPKPPYRLEDNASSLLDAADLVFIDPISTGFSRAEQGEDPKQFHGFENDIESVSEFIRLYTTRAARWESPKFLIGESYGGIRAAGVAKRLQDDFGMYLNGIVLVSAVLDFKTLRTDPGNDLPFVLFLPGLTASAHYHGKLEGSLGDALAAAEAFAMDEYEPALLRGARLDSDPRAAVAAQLSQLTGVREEFFLQANLRLDPSQFRKELLREEGKTIGRFDSRVTGIDADRSGSRPAYDPSHAALTGVFSTMLNAYVRDTLEFESDLPYEVLTRDVHPWSYEPFTNRYVNVSDDLASAMTHNPHLRIFAACGYYDLATPYFAMEYSLSHLPVDASLRDNITIRHYQGGHMMYTNQASLRNLKAHLADFVTAATGAEGGRAQ